ncbi:hypothetical protein OB947_02375 [Aeromonas bestiarum]|uniref:hypothetical protein n=1 Tax=Aeromonas bestiarum TaxID=105751 RepID=UPI00259D94B3|nr:hypothetical protein [Aeromonas bestiarum]MDM5087760.1 hypothetical protein [Aeromonas bestiarum]
MELIEMQKPLSQSPFVFESTSKAGHPISGDAVTKALDRVRMKYLAELEPFSPHDLRRSVATGAAEYLDAPERLIELMLNHVPKDRLIRTYQVGTMADKLKALFLRWGDFIEASVARPSGKPDNVISVSFGRQKDVS